MQPMHQTRYNELRIREYDDEGNHDIMMMMMINTPATTMRQWCNDDDDYDNNVKYTGNNDAPMV